MRKKSGIKRFITTFLVLSFFISFSFTISSCAPELKFGDLTICEQIDDETGEPIKPKDEFDISIDKIYATIKVSGVRAEDNKRFTVKNEGTGEIIFDETEKYSTKETGYIEGYFYIETEDRKEDQILLEPGKYVVEFYHKGELIDSASFKVNTPEIRIIDVILANEVDENMEPTNPTNEFSSEDVFYVCAKLNYQIKGNILNAKWYTEQNELIDETEYEIPDNYYGGDSYITFSLSSENPWPGGKYTVEIYLNKSLYGKYDFGVVGEEAPTTASFSQGNVYDNQEYKFSVNYPDNWMYTEEEDETGLEVQFIPTGEVEISVLVIVINEDYFVPDQLSEYVDALVQSVMEEGNFEQVDRQEYSGEIHGFPYEEYDYTLKGEDDSEYGLNTVLINKGDSLFIFSGLSGAEYYDQASEIFVGMLSSLNFK